MRSDSKKCVCSMVVKTSRLQAVFYNAVESFVQPHVHKAVFFMHSWPVCIIFFARCLYYVSYTSLWDIPDAYVHLVLFLTLYGMVKELWNRFVEKVADVPLLKRYRTVYGKHQEEMDVFWKTEFPWLRWVCGVGYVLAVVFILYLFNAELSRFIQESCGVAILKPETLTPVSVDCVWPGVQALGVVSAGHLTARSAILVLYCPSPAEAKIGDAAKGLLDGFKKMCYGGASFLWAGTLLGCETGGFNPQEFPQKQYNALRGRPAFESQWDFFKYTNYLKYLIQTGQIDGSLIESPPGHISSKLMKHHSSTTWHPILDERLSLADKMLLYDMDEEEVRKKSRIAMDEARRSNWSWAARGFGFGKK